MQITDTKKCELKLVQNNYYFKVSPLLGMVQNGNEKGITEILLEPWGNKIFWGVIRREFLIFT